MLESEREERESQVGSADQSGRSLSRREFLKMAGVAGAAVGLAGGLGGLLAACGGETTTTTAGGETTTTAAGATTTVSAGGQAETLKIGLLSALSGWCSTLDAVQTEEVYSLRDWLNNNGGITVKGQKYNLEIAQEDIKSTMDGASAAANKLILDVGVKYVVGTGFFFNSVIAPIAAQHKVVHCPTYCTMIKGEFDSTTPYSFLCHNSWPANTEAMVTFMQANYASVKKLVLICVDDGNLDIYKPIGDKILNPLGYEIVDWVTFSDQLQDFTPISAKLHSQTCDAYYMLNGILTHIGPILKGLREIGNNKPYFSALEGNAKDLLTIVGNPDLSDVTTVANTAGGKSNPQVLNDMIASTQERLGEKYSVYTDLAGSLYILVRMMEKAQSLDPTEIVDFWNQQSEVETIQGPGLMGGLQTFGIAHAVCSAQPIQWIKDGAVIDYGHVPAKALP